MRQKMLLIFALKSAKTQSGIPLWDCVDTIWHKGVTIK